MSTPPRKPSPGALALNGSAILNQSRLRLTSTHPQQSGSAFSTSLLPVGLLVTSFAVQLTNALADGFAFTLQNNTPSALGDPGASLGYKNIPNSVAANPTSATTRAKARTPSASTPAERSLLPFGRPDRKTATRQILNWTYTNP